jgi:hypothetical protein
MVSRDGIILANELLIDDENRGLSLLSPGAHYGDCSRQYGVINQLILGS